MFGKVERTRLFIAIDISDQVRSALKVYVNGLKEVRAKGVRWEKVEKIHVTLKFLGDTLTTEIPAIQSVFESIAWESKKFELDLESTGVFPSPQKARVLWIGVQPNETLRLLNANFENRLEPLGFSKESRRFSPHLTIARVRDARKAKDVIDKHAALGFELIRMPVNELVLYESTLLNAGSVYSPVFRVPIQTKN